MWKEWKSTDEIGIIASMEHGVGKNDVDQTNPSVVKARCESHDDDS